MEQFFVSVLLCWSIVYSKSVNVQKLLANESGLHNLQTADQDSHQVHTDQVTPLNAQALGARLGQIVDLVRKEEDAAAAGVVAAFGSIASTASVAVNAGMEIQSIANSSDAEAKKPSTPTTDNITGNEATGITNIILPINMYRERFKRQDQNVTNYRKIAAEWDTGFEEWMKQHRACSNNSEEAETQSGARQNEGLTIFAIVLLAVFIS